MPRGSECHQRAVQCDRTFGLIEKRISGVSYEEAKGRKIMKRNEAKEKDTNDGKEEQKTMNLTEKKNENCALLSLLDFRPPHALYLPTVCVL